MSRCRLHTKSAPKTSIERGIIGKMGEYSIRIHSDNYCFVYFSIAGDKRDGCLQFSMNLIPKSKDVVSAIIPKRITLWVHVKKKRGRPRRLNAQVKSSGAQERRMDPKNQRIKGDRRKQKGRKIKLFISNGKKRLSKMRMRIYGSGWHSIDLPISQFPDLIHSTDKFKICIHCKRCNKKVKVVLYRRQKVHKNNRKPLIPLIHFETADYLAPRTIYRHKRSHQNSHHCKQSCCKLETITVDITKTFPTIIAPKEILFTYCINTCETGVSLQNTSVIYEHTATDRAIGKPQHNERNYHHRQCLPHKYNSFSFLYLLPNSDVMFGTIPDMFPSACRCSRTTRGE